MPNLRYLLSAYLFFWALTFVLVLSIWVRQRRLEREIAKLQELLADKLAREAEGAESGLADTTL